MIPIWVGVRILPKQAKEHNHNLRLLRSLKMANKAQKPAKAKAKPAKAAANKTTPKAKKK